jgi:hypothetical protein
MLSFWEFCNERHRIYKRRQAGDKWPWTDEKILQEYYFCNIFRELDTTTIWFKENIRGPLHNHGDVIMATVIFRWFNRIATGNILLRHNLLVHWDTTEALLQLEHETPVVTGAYIIKTPNGMDKLHGVCWSIDQMWARRSAILSYITECDTLEQAWRYLSLFPYQGPFMSYEVVTDLRHTAWLSGARDIMTWANIGPGAKKGLGYIGMAPTQNALHVLLAQSEKYWLYDRMEIRDIEHALCEYAKYRNALAGEKLKRRYHHGN